MWKKLLTGFEGAARKDDGGARMVEGVVDSDSFVLKISSSAAV